MTAPRMQSHLVISVLTSLILIGGALTMSAFQPIDESGTESQDNSQVASSDQSTTQPQQDPIDEANLTLPECVITLTTGRKLTGLMMESSDESVVLRINGIDTTYRRARIASIDFLPPINERFDRLRAGLADSDIDGRLILVDWLRDRRAYSLAILELDSILELEPNHPEAGILKTWLEQHLKLARSRSQRSPERSPEKVTRREPIKKNNIPMLTDEQINIIRVYEIDLDNPPRLKIDDSTIRELMLSYPEKFPADDKQRDAILKASTIDKLKLMFRERARDLYPQVKVLEHPESFDDFKKHIAGRTGWLINGCATTRCHGGEEAGRFQLSNHNPNSNSAIYTNFIRIEQFKLADGTPLINHAEPERSPLVQMAMVRSRSLYPHPTIDPTKHGRDWRPIFRSNSTSGFRKTVDWIRSLYTPRPDYGFEYPPAEADTPTPEQTPNKLP